MSNGPPSLPVAGRVLLCAFFFFLNDAAPPEIFLLPFHDALPIFPLAVFVPVVPPLPWTAWKLTWKVATAFVARLVQLAVTTPLMKIGIASWRERGEMLVVAGSLKRK